jgi:Saxitoxin biosynthesis operon protein SxtJ
MKNVVDNKQLRSFGLIVGGIFAVIAVWPLVIHSAEPRWWSLIVAAVLVLPAVVYPQSLYWPHKGWMAVGTVLGWINTRIILGAVFFFVVTPIGAVRRLLGKDPMGKKLKSDVDSYRVLRKPRTASHLTRQY